MLQNDRISNSRAFFLDEISLRIFDKRIEIGNDVKKQIFPETLEFTGVSEGDKIRILHFTEEIKKTDREKFIYGAGIGCRSILERESARALTFEPSGIIDNNVKGERYGLPIITFAEFLDKHRGALVLNSVGIPTGQTIHKQCVEHDIEVVSLFELDRSWNQYFDLPQELGLVGKDEVFIHAGCYNGDTQKSFINWFGETYERMITFEPGEKCYDLCKDNLSKFSNIEIIQAGLSNISGVAKFEVCSNMGQSNININGESDIKIVSIDDFMNERKVTFIALDIEGAEYETLQGAEQIIRTQKPKLAISCYHKLEDMWELPELIKSYNPDYKLYLRHYHLLDMAETVLYAL